MCRTMADSKSCTLALVPVSVQPDEAEVPAEVAAELAGEPGLADVVTLQRRRAAELSTSDEQSFFLDTLAEYQWARDVAGLAASTLDKLLQPIVEICQYYGVVPWRLTPRQVDRYFAGPGKRGRLTLRRKTSNIDGYFAFLEQRYAGEIARRFGVAVESPIDPFNRPRHRGEFGLRVPPSQQALRQFFASWRVALPQARKPAVACRDYVMAKIAYISGVRASELCQVRISDVHWESGQWGRFLVNGKGAGGSGPRQREAYLFAEGRELLWWYVEEIRGLFGDDPEDSVAPLWPSERLPGAVAALNVPTPGLAVTPSTFRRALRTAGALYLPGPVTDLFPHLLRHACATHNYERGMSLWEVQKLLGHAWTTTTVRYLATAHADPERASLASADRAVQRLAVDRGACGEVEPALGRGPAGHLAAQRAAGGLQGSRLRAVAEQGRRAVGPKAHHGAAG
jgi:integrase/recombinase XerC